MKKVNNTDHSRIREVFCGTAWQAALVKGLLTQNGIDCMVLNEILCDLAPYIAPTVTIYVVEEQVQHAMELITQTRLPHVN